MVVIGSVRKDADLGDVKITRAICFKGSFSTIFEGIKGVNSLTGFDCFLRLSRGFKKEGAEVTEGGAAPKGVGVVWVSIDVFCLISGGNGSWTEETATAALSSSCFSIGLSGIAFGGCIFIFVCVSCGAGLSAQIRPAIKANADKFKMMLGCRFFITPKTCLFPKKQAVPPG